MLFTSSICPASYFIHCWESSKGKKHHPFMVHLGKPFIKEVKGGCCPASVLLCSRPVQGRAGHRAVGLRLFLSRKHLSLRVLRVELGVCKGKAQGGLGRAATAVSACAETEMFRREQ